MEYASVEKKIENVFFLEKLGRGLREVLGEPETLAVPDRMKELLVLLEKVTEPEENSAAPSKKAGAARRRS